MRAPDDMPHMRLGETLDVWWDDVAQMLCFYDFTNDDQLALEVREWSEVLDWWASLGVGSTGRESTPP